MKKKTDGVQYDTANADGIANHDAEDGKTSAVLYRTTEGKYFLHTEKLQVRYRGTWRDTLMDGSARPLSQNHDDYRFVGTSKPLSVEEAIDWSVSTLVPECLATVIQDRLEDLRSLGSEKPHVRLVDRTERSIVYLQDVLLKKYGKTAHPCGRGYSDCTLYIAHNEVNLTNKNSHIVAEDAEDAAGVLSEAKAA